MRIRPFRPAPIGTTRGLWFVRAAALAGLAGLAAFLALRPSDTRADEIELKSGTKYVGRVLQRTGDSVTFQVITGSGTAELEFSLDQVRVLRIDGKAPPLPTRPAEAPTRPASRPVAVSRPTQTAPVKPKSQYADGTYRASSRGYKSDIVVEVVIRNGRITTCRVVSQDETPAYYNRVTNIPGQIVRNQGVQGVATVTGSTRSSRAILQAADDAIQQARAAQNAESPLATP